MPLQGKGPFRSAYKLISSITLCLGTGMAGSFFTRASLSDWYMSLRKPWFTPPGWLFGPVWTILYIMMGIALYLVWADPRKGLFRRRALWSFGVQLLLNFAWSLAFFGLRSPMLGLAVILALLISIAVTIYYFRIVSRTAAFLLYPYLLWVIFATFLNLSIWKLNL
ncbi:MAG: tryptophan-rich sensory protein [Synergistales bacterium]|nr:tryptophan-rich sensory protein [Synergistales bacterium]